MRAVSDRYSIEDRALIALMAGIDVLLFCHELDEAIQAFEAVNDAAEADAAVRARVDKSYRRVIALKQSFLKKFTGLDRDGLRKHLSSAEHQARLAVIQGNL